MDHKNLEYWQTKKDLNLWQAWWGEVLTNYDFCIIYRPRKSAGKPDILSCKSGDSPWEGEAKHQQNKDRILLLEQNFMINTTDMIRMEEDGELIKTIKSKMTTDSEIQDILKKTKNWQMTR
jgi:hypothetical protein